jgi:hypothetical protein
MLDLFLKTPFNTLILCWYYNGQWIVAFGYYQL